MPDRIVEPPFAYVELPFAYFASCRRQRARKSEERWLVERLPFAISNTSPEVARPVLRIVDDENRYLEEWRHDGQRFLKPLDVGLRDHEEKVRLTLPDLLALTGGKEPADWPGTPDLDAARPHSRRTNYPLPQIPFDTTRMYPSEFQEDTDIFGEHLAKEFARIVEIDRDQRDAAVAKAMEAAAGLTLINDEVWVACEEPVLYNHYGVIALDAPDFPPLSKHNYCSPDVFWPALAVGDQAAKDDLEGVHVLDVSVFTDRFASFLLPLMRNVLAYHAAHFSGGLGEIAEDSSLLREKLPMLQAIAACDDHAEGLATTQRAWQAIAEAYPADGTPLFLWRQLKVVADYASFDLSMPIQASEEEEAMIEALAL